MRYLFLCLGLWAGLSSTVSAQTPVSAHDHYNAGLTAQAAERWKDAEAAYQEALQQEPLLRPALHNLALLYLQQQRPAEAQALLEPALSQWRTDARLHRLLGHAYQGLNRPEEAQRAFHHTLALTPDREARQALVQALALPTAPAPQPWPEAQHKAYTQGLFHLERKAWGTAQQHFQAAQQAGPPQADIAYRLAQVAQAQQQLALARQAWQETLRLNPAHTAARQALAEDARQRGDWATSLREYQTLLKYRPAHLSAYGPLAQLLERQGQWEQAQREREQLHSLDPCHGDNPYRLAILYVRSGQTAPAQALLSQQAACRPLAEASLLQAQLAQAEPERAAELYQTALKRWPQSAPVWAAYAQWELAQGRTDSAAKAAAQAFKLNSGNPEVRLLQAQLALLQGQPEQGLQLLAGLTQLASRPDYQRQHLLALVQTGQYRQALPALEAYLKRYPSERNVWEPVRQQMLAALKQRKGRF